MRGVAHHTEGLPWWDGIQHSLPCYSVSALILAGIVPHLPWSEARGRRQRLPGISCTMRQRHASSSGTLLTQAPTNLLEAPRLLGTAQASAPCQYLLRCDARRCFQQRGHQAQPQPPASAWCAAAAPGYACPDGGADPATGLMPIPVASQEGNMGGKAQLCNQHSFLSDMVICKATGSYPDCKPYFISHSQSVY